MPDDNATYDSYVRFCKLVGSPVLDFESWSRKRSANFLEEQEANSIREKWLAEGK